MTAPNHPDPLTVAYRAGMALGEANAAEAISDLLMAAGMYDAATIAHRYAEPNR